MDKVQFAFLGIIFLILMAMPSIDKLVNLAREQRKKHFEELEKDEKK
jgi:hypothetical protein